MERAVGDCPNSGCLQFALRGTRSVKSRDNNGFGAAELFSCWPKKNWGSRL
ncbi:hypothetical protein [Methylomonas albis]|nr:hypothetical protein [Methylomonas albis]